MKKEIREVELDEDNRIFIDGEGKGTLQYNYKKKGWEFVSESWVRLDGIDMQIIKKKLEEFKHD